MYQGDIIRYNLDAYGFDVDVILEIIDIKPCNERIVVKPVQGEWPLPLLHWRDQETLSAEYIQEFVYTIAPQTP
jgi:hypothetical protein